MSTQYATPHLADPATYHNGVPHELFHELRAATPVAWVEEPTLLRHSPRGSMAVRGPGLWAVTRHRDLVEAAQTPAVYSSAARGAFLSDPRTPADLAQARQLLVNMDAPQHAKIRKVVARVFTPKAVAGLQASIHTHATELVTRSSRMGEFDGVADLAAELPLLVLADLLGIPRADRAHLFRWSNHLVGFDDPAYGGGDIDAFKGALLEAHQYAREIRKDRMLAPRDDLCSRLAHAEVDGERLTPEEFANFWLLLVVAGNETTRHLISGSLQALADDPAQTRRLTRGEVTTHSATEELLRFVSPVMQFRRTATRDTSLGGAEIAAGDKVVLYFVAGNRDPEVFANPDHLDLGRDPNRHLSFGIGPHFCLGAHLARAEMQEFLTAMLPYLDTLEVLGVERLSSTFVNGIKSLPCRIS